MPDRSLPTDPGRSSGDPAMPLVRVLLIEDDPEDAELTRRTLRGMRGLRADVRWVDRYELGVRALREREFDVVLLDHRLGGRTGIELIAEAIVHAGEVPVVMLTGLASAALDTEAPAIGVADLMEKEFLSPLLIERSIRYAMERARTERALRQARAFFEAAFDALHDHVALLDADGTILEVNEAWRRFAADNGLRTPDFGRGASYLAVCDAGAQAGIADAREAAAGIRSVVAGEVPLVAIDYPCHSPVEFRWFRMEISRFETGGAARVLVTHENISDRYRAEQQLRASEARYRSLFNQIPVPMWVLHQGSLGFLAVNDAAVRHYGYAREEFLAMTAMDICPPEDVQALLDSAREAEQRPVLTRPARHLKRNGELIDVEITVHGIGFDGHPAHLVLAADITARRAAEQERETLFRSLQFERNRLTAIFEKASSFIAVLRGPDHVFEMANEAYYDLIGRRELIGRSVWDALSELTDTGLGERLDAVLETGEVFTVARMELHLQRQPHAPLEQRYVSFAYQPLEEEDGTRSGVFVHGVDVTDQVEAERVIRESEERHRLLVELSPDGIVIHDGTKIRFANSAALRLMGATPNAPVAGSSLRNFIHEESQATALGRIAGLQPGERTRPLEQRWVALDGTTREVEVASVKFVYAGEELFQTVFRDISDRRQLEDQLRQAQKMEAVGRLAGGVAHDFNNLLTVIGAHADMLTEDLGAASESLGDVKHIRDATDRAAGLTRQLLAFSRKQILEPRPVDLREVVRNIMAMLTRLITEDVALETMESPSIGRVMADPGQIEQILMNLAVNARDAMPAGGRIVIETADVALEEHYAMADRSPVVPGDYVMLAVSDSGHGMTAEVQARIFEPFFTTKPVGQGTGLGLATVYGIVKQSGGHIWVYSEPGVGTTFKVYFPRISDERASAVVHDAGGPASTGTETVLIVEDEDALRAVAKRILEKSGYRVMEARTGAEALRLATQYGGRIDLVLTDVIMPEMSGGALAERLCAVRPNLRVVYMSGYTDGDIVRRGVLKSGSTFLQKPFQASQLLALIRTAMDSR